MTQHEPWCKVGSHSDAARRLYEVYNLHYIVKGLDAVGQWLAVTLADGESDGTLYDTKRECITHQHHNEQRCAFVKMIPCMMKVCEAEVVLGLHRRMYDAGLKMTDPDDRHGGKDFITRLTVEDQLALMHGRATNLILPGRN